MTCWLIIRAQSAQIGTFPGQTAQGERSWLFLLVSPSLITSLALVTWLRSVCDWEWESERVRAFLTLSAHITQQPCHQIMPARSRQSCYCKASMRYLLQKEWTEREVGEAPRERRQRTRSLLWPETHSRSLSGLVCFFVQEVNDQSGKSCYYRNFSHANLEVYLGCLLQLLLIIKIIQLIDKAKVIKTTKS